jgi:hypothetical protein
MDLLIKIIFILSLFSKRSKETAKWRRKGWPEVDDGGGLGVLAG